MKAVVPKKIIAILNSNTIQIISQLILGGLFIYAGLPKILNLEIFSSAIRNYKLIPEFLVGMVSFILPLIEIIFGTLLVLNIKPKLAAAVLSILLVIFILAISQALIRGIDIDCGCFVKSLLNPQASKSNGLYVIIRDFLFLIPGLIIICRQESEQK